MVKRLHIFLAILSKVTCLSNLTKLSKTVGQFNEGNQLLLLRFRPPTLLCRLHKSRNNKIKIATRHKIFNAFSCQKCQCDLVSIKVKIESILLISIPTSCLDMFTKISCLFVLFITTNSVEFEPISKRLKDDLLANYSTFVRPVRNVSKPVHVWIELNLRQILNVVSTVSSLAFRC